MERPRVDARAELLTPGALRQGGQEHVLRRGQAVARGRVVLGQVIRVEARGVEALDLEQARAIDPIETHAENELDAFEDPESQGRYSLSFRSS